MLAKPQDLAALHAKCFSVPRPWSTDEFGAFLDDPTITFIPCAAGAHVGFAVMRLVLDEAELLTICVDPACRGTGIGRALLENTQRIARAKGAAHIVLEVAATNAAAHALYVGAGYKSVGMRRDYYRNPGAAAVHAHVLRLDLPNY